MKIGVITGTTRPGNVGSFVGKWVAETLADRTDVTIVPVAVADFDLDLLNEPTHPGAANGNYENPKTQKWAAEIAQLDGFLFITPEYNAAPPAAFKNAFDLLFAEWTEKPVGFVGYSYHGAENAIKHWRDIVAIVKMKAVDSQVMLNLGTETVVDGKFQAAEGQAENLNKLLDEVISQLS
ncbi:NADPH-dependent FMN reductase [Boudabousia marimammalium]|uniref:NADPH-dependent FMN reductase-like domain-containing protein n=1 Tax=Boudabousia marimammalium TaxID=156892 RepID=A0A1Q5PQR5_9ACTO|nr:NAD(P)H-dependent oxidoreductase [Boudabousia marimammalium]OKL49961.1 hypothetical protein BM477_03435 [Boudabousia marimammalium]